MHNILIGNNFCITTFRLAAPRPQILKKWQKNQKFRVFIDFFKKIVQIGHIIACSTRLVNAFKDKIIVIDFF
jgi:hypothetical protein